MRDAPEEILDAAQRAALAGLPHELSPPAGLEGTIVRGLAARGLLRPSLHSAGRWRRTAAALAAGLLLLAGGFLAGNRQAKPPAAPGTTLFLLLLREDASFKLPPGGSGELVNEYRRWAGTLRQRGLLETGEELAGSGYLLSGGALTAARSGGAADRITGYFVIRARGEAEALRWARGCPHLRHGGRLEIRPILPT